MALSIVLGALLKKQKLAYAWLMGFALVVVAAIRSYTVGVDTLQYWNAFNIINAFSVDANYNRDLEIGFQYLCLLLGHICSSPQVLLIATSVFGIGSIIYFLYKNSSNFPLAIYLFISLNYYSFCMSGMRQMLAIAIIVIGIEACLKKQHTIYYLLIVLVASLFHTSALLMMVLPLFSRVRVRPRSIVFALLLAVVAMLFADQVFKIANSFLPYGAYEGTEYSTANYFGAIFQMLVDLMILIFSFLCYSTDRNSSILMFSEKNFVNEKKAALVKANGALSIPFLLVCSGVAVICSFLSIKMGIFSRVEYYFKLFSILGLTNAVVEGNRKLQTLTIILTVGMSFAYWIVVALYRPEWYGVVPYELFI